MSKESMTIPRASHLFAQGPMRVTIYNVYTPSERTLLDEEAVTMDPLTQAVHITLANGERMRQQPPDADH